MWADEYRRPTKVSCFGGETKKFYETGKRSGLNLQSHSGNEQILLTLKRRQTKLLNFPSSLHKNARGWDRSGIRRQCTNVNDFESFVHSGFDKLRELAAESFTRELV